MTARTDYPELANYAQAARGHPLDEEAPEALDEIDRLRADLREQWEWNHAEHCTNGWPHEGDCHWPLPVSLGGTPADYRTYQP